MNKIKLIGSFSEFELLINEADDKNLTIKTDASDTASFDTYVTCFVEALNCLDSMAALASGVNPDANATKNYRKNRWNIAIIGDPTEETLNKIWDNLKKIAGDSGLSNVVRKTITKNDVYKSYQEEKKVLDDNLVSKKIKKDDYRIQIDKLVNKYSNMLGPIQSLMTAQTAEAIDLYAKAIDYLKQGADIELEYVKKKKDPESFYERVIDTIIAIIRSKKPDSYKREADSTYYSDFEDVFESLASTLGQSKPFASGVIKGVKDLFKKDGDSGDSGVDKNTLLSIIEDFKSQLMSAASFIDNIIGYKRNARNKKSAEEAKASAAEMISFIRDSYKYLAESYDKVQAGNDIKPISAKIKEIGNTLSIYQRPGGMMEKWRDEVLGVIKAEDGSVIQSHSTSNRYLQNAREMMAKAALINDKKINYEKSVDKLKDYQAERQVKKAIDAWNGVTTKDSDKDKKHNIARKYMLDPNKADKEDVKAYQERLIDTGYLAKGVTDGEYNEMLQNVSDDAMKSLGRITGKAYNRDSESFVEFQKDLDILNDKKKDIRKELELE